jgi:hypothetical protein
VETVHVSTRFLGHRQAYKNISISFLFILTDNSNHKIILIFLNDPGNGSKHVAFPLTANKNECLYSSVYFVSFQNRCCVDRPLIFLIVNLYCSNNLKYHVHIYKCLYKRMWSLDSSVSTAMCYNISARTIQKTHFSFCSFIFKFVCHATGTILPGRFPEMTTVYPSISQSLHSNGSTRYNIIFKPICTLQL